jgi:hypothetical protein
MTAIAWGATPSVPTNINTLERLLFHSTSAAQAAWGGLTFKLDDNNPQVPWITMSDGYVLAQAKKLVKVELYLPINGQIDNNGLNQRPWMYAEEISNNAYPAGFNAL